MPTTWNPADKDAGVTLSGGNLVASGTGIVRATNSVATGNYFEVKGNSVGPGEPATGIVTTGHTVSGGGSGYIVAHDGSQFVVYNASDFSTATTFAGSIANNDVFGFAVKSLRLYISHNGSYVVGSPTGETGGLTLAGGTYYPFGEVGAGIGGGIATLQADTTTYSPPTGYSLIGGGGTPSNDLIVTETGPDTISSSGTVDNGPFPVVAARAQARTTAVDTTTHAITLPSGIAAGNLLVVVFSVDGSPTVTVNTGVSGNNWNKLGQASNTTVVTGAVFWKIAEGSDALTLTTSAAEQSSHITFRLTNAADLTGTSANGSSTNSNPPSHTPAAGSDDYYWIATRSGDSTVVATAAPANFSNLQTLAGVGTSSASTNTAERLFTGTSLDPGTFTSATEQWVSWTLAVAPPQPAITGSLAATESGSDTFAAIGSAGSAGSTGSLAATETGSDTIASSGLVLVAGSLSATENGPDTLVSSGTVLVSGSLAATESGSDTFAATGGAIVITGSLAASESGNDTIAATGNVPVLGALAATETGSDTLAGLGTILVQGALTATEGGADTLVSSGTVRVAGALSAQESGSDIFSGSGVGVSSGVLTAAEGGPDTASLLGLILVSGNAIIVETGSDTAASTGSVRVSGGLAASEGLGDTAAFAGAILLSGSLSANEGGQDTFAAAGGLGVNGLMAALEVGSDTFAATGTVSAGYPDPIIHIVTLRAEIGPDPVLLASIAPNPSLRGDVSGPITLQAEI